MVRSSAAARALFGIALSLVLAAAWVGAGRAQDAAPVVTAPGTQSTYENLALSFQVTASDPDGDAILALTASGLPSGATFTVNLTNTAGTFQWTPTSSQVGNHIVTFTASNALAGSRTTLITVSFVDYFGPVVTAPATASGSINHPITFTVTASVPAGITLVGFTASPLPAGARFTTNATYTSGTFSWTPSAAQAGTYNVTFRAFDSTGHDGSSMTSITVVADRAPVVYAPPTQSVCPGVLLSFTVSASDPDGEAIASLTASGVPSGATFTVNATNTSGTFQWNPSFNQDGSYSVVFTASNSLSGSATTVILVLTCDPAPVVTAPAIVTGQTEMLIAFTVSAGAPDGATIVSLAASPLPAGATFTSNAAHTSGTFAWTPAPNQAGTYSVTFTATNTIPISGSAQTSITVIGSDRAPVVAAPAVLTGCRNTLLACTVSASDPDGDPINSLTASGTAMTAGGTFTSNASHTSGTFSWTPTFTQAGSYSVTFTASNALSGSATTNVTIPDCGRPPVVIAPSTVLGMAGDPILFTVSANDPDGEEVTQLTAAPLPVGATFATNATHTSGTFAWTPTLVQSGVYDVVFTASNYLSGSRTSRITVSPAGNLAPVAEADGPYTGLVGGAVVFDGTGSSDPDGDALTYSWSFGDGGTGNGATPAHTYLAPGSFTATLTVSDGFLTGSDTAPVQIQAFVQARVFTAKPRFRRLRLGSAPTGKIWCAQVEPIAGNFSLDNVDLSSVELEYNGATVSAQGSKGSVVSDTDRNGILELEVCFAVSDLQGLNFPTGTNVVSVVIRGDLLSGGQFAGAIDVEVVNGSGQLAALIAPNPLNPEAVLSFQTIRSGRARVRIFDLAGRLVGTPYDTEAAPGRHEVRIDGRSAAGTPLASGIYFYRIESRDGTAEGRFTILK